MKYIFALVVLVLLIISVFTAHTMALSVLSLDKVDISILIDMNKSSWEKMESGDVATVEIAKPTTAKISLSSVVDAKKKVEPVVQINPGASLVVEGNYAGGDSQIVQVGKDKIEGYYSYGKSSAYPWGIYWCIHDISGKPMIVFSEFSKRSVWYSPISSAQVEEIAAILNKGTIPDITLIQKAAGA